MAFEACHREMTIAQTKLESLDADLREKELDLDALYLVQEEHHRQKTDITQHFQSRIAKLNRVNLNPDKIHFLAIYKEKMSGLLQKKETYFQLKEQEEAAIKKGLQRVSDEIEALKKQQLLSGQQLSNLQDQIKRRSVGSDE